MQSGVPQASILGPILYLHYTYNLPINGNYFTATFADDTALLAGEDTESTLVLQSAIDKLCNWTKEWRIQLNNAKLIHVDFSNLNITNQNVYIDHIVAKYLGMKLDVKLKWKEHIKKKKSRAWSEVVQNVLAHWKKIRTVNKKQNSFVQPSHQTSLDIWYTALGLHQSSEH